jgi:HSP20 family protein
MTTRLTVWEPFRDMMTLHQAMDRLFEDSFVRTFPRWTNGQRGTLYLPVDAYETDNEIVVNASLPGMKPDEVEITFEAETVTIKGETKPPIENVNYVIRERCFGLFARTLTFNVPVQADKAEATFENGVLTLTVPKAEEVRPRQIKVKTK